MSSVSPYVLLALVAGACLPAQAGINSQLNIWARSPVLASAISFAVGTLCLVLYTLVVKTPLPSFSETSAYPWWIWSGGLIGAFFVASTIILAPRLGAAPMLGLIVAGQMAASLFLDHFGCLGYPLHPLNLWRVVGMVFITGGVVLIRIY
jgi:transporter family-2 protein